MAFAADEECPTRVAVVTPDPELREKIRTQVLPEIEPQPLLIEPDGIPLIDDAERARRQPRETIFAALYHVAHTREPLEARVAGLRAALIANRTLDEDERLRYGELMLAMTPSEIMQRALEALEEDDEFDEPNKLDPANLPTIFRNGCLFVTGKEEGLVQGREEGLVQGQLGALREVLVDILAARGVEIDESIHTRIHQCQHAPTLARWCAAASSVAAGSLQALLDE